MHVPILKQPFVLVAVRLCLQTLSVLLVFFELTFVYVPIGAHVAPFAVLFASVEFTDVLGAV